MNRTLYLESRSSIGSILHQHHYLLLFAWKIKQGLLNQTESKLLKNYIKYFYNTILLQHMNREEELLLKALQKEDMVGQTLLFGHNSIREKIRQILDNTSSDDANFESLCKTLVEVVRYEEKKFFPYLEEKLGGLESSWIKYKIVELDEEITDDYQPEFWKEKRNKSSF